jgi:hypothetical protein
LEEKSKQYSLREEELANKNKWAMEKLGETSEKLAKYSFKYVEPANKFYSYKKTWNLQRQHLKL